MYYQMVWMKILRKILFPIITQIQNYQIYLIEYPDRYPLFGRFHNIHRGIEIGKVSIWFFVVDLVDNFFKYFKGVVVRNAWTENVDDRKTAVLYSLINYRRQLLHLSGVCTGDKRSTRYQCKC